MICKHRFVAALLTALLLCDPASAFAAPRANGAPRTRAPSPRPLSTALRLRGGGEASAAAALRGLRPDAAMDWASAALRSGPLGVVALSGVASAVVVPLTLLRQGYRLSP